MNRRNDAAGRYRKGTKRVNRTLQCSCYICDGIYLIIIIIYIFFFFAFFSLFPFFRYNKLVSNTASVDISRNRYRFQGDTRRSTRARVAF